MKVSYENGLRVGNLTIDPERQTRAEHVLITHAHSDHVKLNKESNFLMSKETHKLVKSRFKKDFQGKSLSFGKKHKVDGVSLTLSESGHILGSSQSLVEGDGKSLAVSSDFKLQDSLVTKSAKPISADILVIETTFGLPSYSFPERTQVYEDMGNWLKQNEKDGCFSLLAGYSLGKAQELTAISNQYAGVSPIVHESVFENNEVYKNFGVNLGKYLKLNHNLGESSVLIMPPSLVDAHLLQALEISTGKKIRSAMATGWPYRRCYDRIFPLSDHADFAQLESYVQQSNPKLVLTTHGFSKQFARHVQRRLKIPARPLEEAWQKSMAEFF